MSPKNPLADVSRNLLFQFAIPLRRTDQKWGDKFALDDSYRLPVFGTFEGQPPFARICAAWSEEGIGFDVSIRGKKHPLKCQATRVTKSDGIQVWIDTRNTQSIQRASRFCHWFAYMPTGGGNRQSQAWGTMIKINRAKEDAKTFPMFKSMAVSQLFSDGYRLSFLIPAAALGGWNTDEHRRIGFHYAVIDHEMGWQTLAADFRLPIAENPSLWHTLELQDAKA